MNIFRKLWNAIFPASAEPQVIDIRSKPESKEPNPTFSEQWKPAEPVKPAAIEFPKSKPEPIKPPKKATTKKTTSNKKKK